MRHKFINKKTGAEARVMAIYLDSDGVMQVDGYDTVEDLMDNYAAYEEYNPPKEPLIKDEKIRKAVKAFAELNNSATIIFELSYGKSSIIAKADNGFAMLWVAGESWETNGKGIKWDEPYTIAELCGEEEQCGN